MDEKIEVALRGEEFKRLLGNQFSEIRHKYGLKTVDIEILVYLYYCQDEDTPSDIFRRSRINKGHISQAIDDLIKKGYINSIADLEDRRVIHYHINHNAKEIMEEILQIKHKIESKIMAGLSKSEIEQYRNITCRILQNIEGML